MHRDPRVEIRLLHLVKEDVAQDAGIVHDSVDAPEIIDRGLYHGLRAGPIGDAVAVGNGVPAKLLDFIDNLLCRRRIGGVVSPDRAAQIVDDHRSSGPRQIERYAATDTPASSGDEGDLAFHAAGHDELLSFSLL